MKHRAITLPIVTILILMPSNFVSAVNEKCRVRNFTTLVGSNLCENMTDTSLALFLGNGITLEAIVQQANTVLRIIDELGSDFCMDFFKQFACLYAFPPCNVTTGRPHYICEDTCNEVLFGPRCVEETLTARHIYSRDLGGHLTFFGGPFPNCSNLPHTYASKETCTSGQINLSLLRGTLSPSTASTTVTVTEHTPILGLIAGVAIAGTAVLLLGVGVAVGAVIRVRRKKTSTFPRLECRDHSNRISCDSTAAMLPSLTEATQMSSATNRLFAKDDERNSRLVKNQQSERYLILPKSTEDIVAALEPEEREHFDDLHKELQEIAENLDHLLVDLNQVVLHEVLGEGAFGLVQKGSLARDGQLTVVAVKSLKDSCAMSGVVEFVRESSMMASFDHPNILPVSGVCLDMSGGRSPLILVPFMENGDLKTFLQKSRLQSAEEEDVRTDLSPIRLLNMCIQIAKGMEYLSGIPIVHRDLAARNCMLDDRMAVKIADFGLSRDIYSNNYYRMGTKGKVPVKWMAPESLTDNIYTTQTDVWSYGVTVWEIYSLGKVPYPGVPNYEVLDYLENEHRLSKPPLCPDEVFTVAMNCWELEAAERPSFSAVKEALCHIAAIGAGYLELETEG